MLPRRTPLMLRNPLFPPALRPRWLLSLLRLPLSLLLLFSSKEGEGGEYGDEAIVGAGTVTDQQKLIDVLETGAKLIVTPNMNPDVISIASKRGCIVMPGIQTTTEAFTALSCGASALKFFPAEVIGAKGIKAMKSVLPEGTVCLPVGGVAANKESMQEYLDVGADGFGLGSGLYQKGMSLEELKSRSHAYKKAWLGTQK